MSSVNSSYTFFKDISCYFYLNFIISVTYQFSILPYLAILKKIRHDGGFGIAKRHISAINATAIRVQHQANVSKQATLLDYVDVGPLKGRLCWCG